MSISAERLERYLTAVGYDRNRALRLYLWNAAMGEAFYLPLQAAEVALRNHINAELMRLYGPNWWKTGPAHEALSWDRRADVDTVLKRLKALQKTESNGQVVAGLSFGFWVGLLQSRYNEVLWNSHLAGVFACLPEKTKRSDVAEQAKHIQKLRNRISHHEPIFQRDLSADFHDVMRFLGWLSPAKASWVRPHCRIPALLRQKP